MWHYKHLLRHCHCPTTMTTIYRDRHHGHKAQHSPNIISNNKIGSPINNHHSWRIRITRNESRHDRTIGNSQSGHFPNTQPKIYHIGIG